MVEAAFKDTLHTLPGKYLSEGKRVLLQGGESFSRQAVTGAIATWRRYFPLSFQMRKCRDLANGGWAETAWE